MVKRILVIKLRHLGDVLLTSPVFSCLQKAYPEAQIDAYLYRESLPMLEGDPSVNDFLLYDQAWKELPFFKRLQKEAKLLWQIRKKRYDLVINLTEGDRGALAALASGSPKRVGIDPGKSGFWRKRELYTHLVKPCQTPRHTVERNLDALRVLGIFPPPEERTLHFAIPEATKLRVELLLEEQGLKMHDFTVVHAVSRWSFKSPPPEKMAQIIRILQERGEKILLTGSNSPKEIAMNQAIASLSFPGLIDWSGKLNLKELGALLTCARGLITVDSVPLHMASALKVPLVVLFGPSSEKNWGPWQHPQSAVVTQELPCRPCFMDGCGGSKKSDCLATLSVDKVLEAYEGINKSLCRF